jgi:hypothetical protein
MKKSMPGLREVMHRSAGMWAERLLPTAGIHPGPPGSLLRTQRSSRAGGRMTGLMDHYSTLTITLSPVSTKTNLSFVQTGVPDDQYEEISQGWYDYYWDPLKKVLEKSS